MDKSKTIKATQMKSLPSRIFTVVNSYSLRMRLILGNMIVTLLAVAGLGYYVYYRAQQQNTYLTDQLNTSVMQQANDKLATTGSGEANELNDFLNSKAKDVTNLGAAAGRLLSREATLGNGAYWNAPQSLYRVPDGSWDSSAIDVAAASISSVFMPAKVDLTAPLIAELNTVKLLDFVAPAILKSNPDALALYFGGVSGDVLYYSNTNYSNVDFANQVPPDYNVTQSPWFVSASPVRDPSHQAVWSAPYQDPAHRGLVVTVSTPVYDAAGEFRGVAAMDVLLVQITEIISNIKIGQTGYSFLINQNQRLIAWKSRLNRDPAATAKPTFNCIFDGYKKCECRKERSRNRTNKRIAALHSLLPDTNSRIQSVNCRSSSGAFNSCNGRSRTDPRNPLKVL